MYSGQRFVNRGYELWSLSRHAWVTAATVADDKSATTTKTTALVKSPPIPAAFRKELIKCLADRRQFELSQRIALSCVIDAYQQVWQNGALD